MPTQVDDYEFPSKSMKGIPHRFRYDWDKVADGNVWKFLKDVDYGNINTIRTAASHFAMKHDIKARTHLDGDVFYIQFYAEETV